MLDFEYYTPTKVYFGRNSDEKIGQVIKEYGYKKILLHYGTGSAEKSGLLGKVRRKLEEAGLEYVELGGVVANPRIDLIRKGIELAKKEILISFLPSAGAV